MMMQANVIKTHLVHCKAKTVMSQYTLTKNVKEMLSKVLTWLDKN